MSIPLKQKVITALRWSAGARLLAQIFNWGMTIVVIRLLAPGDYGLMAMAMVAITLFNMFNEMGIGAAIIQKRESDLKRLRQLLGLLLILAVASYACAYSGAAWLAMIFSEPSLAELLRVAAAQFFLFPFIVIPKSLLEGGLDFKRYSLVDLTASVSAGFATLGFALTGYGVWSLVFGNIVRIALLAVGLNLIRPFLHVPLFSMRGIREQLSFGGWVTLERLLWYLSSQLDTVVIGKVLGKEALGIYAVARHLASLPREKLGLIIGQVAFPAFAALQDDINRLGSALCGSAAMMALLAFPVFWGISAVAPELVELALGEGWSGAVFPLAVMSLAMPLRMIGNINVSAVKALGRARLLVTNQAIAIGIVIPSIAFGAKWGLEGASIAWAVAYPVAFLINIARTGRVTRVASSRLVAAILPFVLASAVMYAAVVSLRTLLAGHYEAWYLLPMLVAAGGGAYMLTTLIVANVTVREAWSLVRPHPQTTAPQD